MWGALGAAAVSAAGQLYANYQNIQNQNKIFGEQINLANTAHQREVNDLRLAGLNPILSAQGSGAETPSAQTAKQENPLADFADMIQLENQTNAVSAQEVTAEAQRQAAITNQWQVYDSKSLGYAGFDVGFGKFGVGSHGKFERVHSIRINKVTGEAYTVPDNRRITSFRPVTSDAVNSANSAPALNNQTATTVGKPRNGIAYTKDGLPYIVVEKVADR